jgi:hypothetical protein
MLDIKPGQASPAQRQAWHKFWQKLVAEVNNPETGMPPSQAPDGNELADGDKESNLLE